MRYEWDTKPPGKCQFFLPLTLRYFVPTLTLPLPHWPVVTLLPAISNLYASTLVSTLQITSVYQTPGVTNFDPAFFDVLMDVFSSKAHARLLNRRAKITKAVCEGVYLILELIGSVRDRVRKKGVCWGVSCSSSPLWTSGGDCARVLRWPAG